MNLNELFRLSLTGRAEQTGLEFAGRRYSFAELDERSDRVAAKLAELGFEAGDRLAVYLPNCVELVDAYLAAVKLGVVFTPINILYREREIAHIIADAEPRAVITNTAVAGCRNVSPAELLAAPQRARAGIAGVEGDAAAALIYTSGTTGRPKGAVLTHHNFAANALALNTCWRMSPEDRLLLALPLFHVHGLGNGLHTWLTTGYRLRLLERFRKETILGEFLDFRPTVFFGVPAMYERLLEAPPEAARRIGAGMRLFVSGSAPLPARTLERFRDLYGHAILERYGMTETLMITSNPYAGERRAGTAGVPLPGVSVRLEDGEVLVRGPSVCAGYWRNEQATRDAFGPGGWFRTGDLGRLSADGYLTLTGRRSDLIISGGFNIYPREIEEVLLEQPGVAEAAVVGEPDPIRGERPVAYVVAKPGARLDPEALREQCRQTLASFKTPARVELVDSLPRNALGKLQRHLLRQIGERLRDSAPGSE